MNQVRIKWVFIVLFLLINLFLLNLLYQSKWKESSISEETLTHTVSVLKQHGVSVDREMIPKNAFRMREVSVRNVTENSSGFFKALEKDGWTRRDDGYQRRDGSLKVSGGRFSYSGKTPLGGVYTGEELVKAVGEAISVLPINSKELRIKTIEQTGEHTLLRFVQTYEDYEIFDTDLTVTVEKDRIIEIGGLLLETVKTNSKRQQTAFATRALMSFALDERRPEKATVTEIKPGYSVGETGEWEGYKVVQMLPVYCITESQGEKFYYDARNS